MNVIELCIVINDGNPVIPAFVAMESNTLSEKKGLSVTH